MSTDIGSGGLGIKTFEEMDQEEKNNHLEARLTILQRNQERIFRILNLYKHHSHVDGKVVTDIERKEDYINY